MAATFHDILEAKLSGAPSFARKPPDRELADRELADWRNDVQLQSLIRELPTAPATGRYATTPVTNEMLRLFNLSVSELTFPERAALASLVAAGGVLPETFNEKDLKKCWRRLTFRLHPDSGLATASAAAFQRAHDAYRLLQKRFVNGRVRRDDPQ